MSYCSVSEKYTYNTCPIRLIMLTNKKLKRKSSCVSFLTYRSFFDKIKHKIELKTIVSHFFIDRRSFFHQTMITYCVKRTENSENLNSKNNRLIMQSKCAVWGIKKSRFLKEQEAKELLSSLGIKTPLNKIPLLGDIFF